MGKKIQDIQAIIDKRAMEKLDRDVATMCEQIRQMPLLRNMNDGQQPSVFIQKIAAKYGDPVPEGYSEYTLPALFNGEINRNGDFTGSLWIKGIRDKWITEYIQRETKLFFDRVDQLETDVADLLNAKNQTHDY